jgi:hypothetical protein
MIRLGQTLASHSVQTPLAAALALALRVGLDSPASACESIQKNGELRSGSQLASDSEAAAAASPSRAGAGKKTVRAQ